MNIRSTLPIGLIATLLALTGIARAEDAAKPPAEPGSSAQACAHHMKAMHAMGTDKQREAYCHAHKDCMSHDCGGMGAKEHGKGPVDPPSPSPKAQPPKP
ncbi:MAG: hypothetical protein WEF50_19340 [Myxococcota bacterium]